jgi:hypothetical protein
MSELRPETKFWKAFSDPDFASPQPRPLVVCAELLAILSRQNGFVAPKTALKRRPRND